MDQTIIDKLYEGLEVDQKPGQGYKYVKTRYVLDRLNKAFKNNWGMQVKEHKIVDDEVLVLVALNVYDDNGNILAYQEGFGSAKKFKNVDLGNLYKSATSKAIKSAARNWGVGLFLDEEDGGEDTPTVAAHSYPINTITTPVYNMPPSDTPSTAIPNFNSMPSTISSTPGTVTSTPVSVPVVNAVPKVTTNLPPGVSTTPTSSTPSVSVLPTMGAVPGSTPMMAGPEAGGTHPLTMVQKVAITSRLNSKGLQFEDVVTEFYASRSSVVPSSVDEMLYADALDMVTFLNSK